MTRIQFLILACIIILVCPLFLVEVLLTRQVRSDEHTIAVLERVTGEGPGFATRFNQLAIRTFQLSQQDPSLKTVLAANHIHISAKAPTNPPALVPAPPPPTPPMPPQ